MSQWLTLRVNKPWDSLQLQRSNRWKKKHFSIVVTPRERIINSVPLIVSWYFVHEEFKINQSDLTCYYYYCYLLLSLVTGHCMSNFTQTGHYATNLNQNHFKPENMDKMKTRGWIFSCRVQPKCVRIPQCVRLCSWRSDWTVWRMRRMILSDVICFQYESFERTLRSDVTSWRRQKDATDVPAALKRFTYSRTSGWRSLYWEVTSL